MDDRLLQLLKNRVSFVILRKDLAKVIEYINIMQNKANEFVNIGLSETDLPDNDNSKFVRLIIG